MATDSEFITSLGVEVSLPSGIIFDANRLQRKYEIKRRMQNHPDTFMESLWIWIISQYLLVKEGYAPYCQLFYFPHDSDDVCGKLLHIDQDTETGSKWVCAIFCVNDENAKVDDIQALQSDYISRVARGLVPDRKLPQDNGGYVGGIIAIGPRTKFYEYRYLGDERISVKELCIEGSSQPIGEVNILEDTEKVHQAVVQLKRLSAINGFSGK